jgi:hypothetical protein
MGFSGWTLSILWKGGHSRIAGHATQKTTAAMKSLIQSVPVL